MISTSIRITNSIFSLKRNFLIVLFVLSGCSEIMPPNFAVWTLLTHCFFEDSFLMLIEDIVAITLYGKLVEPLWGNAEVGSRKKTINPLSLSLSP